MQPAEGWSPAVSRETQERLDCYVSHLRSWNARINLVAPGSLDDVWRRHVVDSLQLLDLAQSDARHWVDLGSGAGLPGLVIAIAALSQRPELRVTLLESDRRKCAFLHSAAHVCGVSVRVLSDRIENAPPQDADVISARALAPLPRLLDLTAPHLAPNGRALFPKGAQVAGELTSALEHWRFQVQTHPSKTSSDGVILAIEGPSRV